MITLIVCMDQSNLISLNGKLPWYIPEELRFFRDVTIDYPIIMGRRTWESLPIKPLPKRLNIVLSKSVILPLENSYGPFLYKSLEEALIVTEKYSNRHIIGGTELYNYTLGKNIADRLIISTIKRKIEVKEGDDTSYLFFPSSNWKEVDRLEKELFTTSYWERK
jgi:dihydrofolate reductase